MKRGLLISNARIGKLIRLCKGCRSFDSKQRVEVRDSFQRLSPRRNTRGKVRRKIRSAPRKMEIEGANGGFVGLIQAQTGSLQQISPSRIQIKCTLER